MRIAIIEYGYRAYLLDTFEKHPESDSEIVCFAEWTPKMQEYQGIPIVSISLLKDVSYDAVLIAVSRNHHLSRLLTYLHDKNIQNIYVIRLFALDTHADFIAGTGLDMSCVDRIPEQNAPPYFVHLETHVCDYCNLNCKSCNNFSPFAKKTACKDTVQFESDIKRLTGLFSGIGRFFLLGGEPLLEPERCCEMIKITRKYFPGTELRLLTNAILIPQMSPNFWECLRECRVIVHISIYPPVEEKLSEIKAVLQENKIPFFLAKTVKKFVKHWTLHPSEDEKFNNNDCGSAGCHYLQNGILSKCPDGILIGNMASALDYPPEALQAKKRIMLSDAEDGWSVIRSLNAPSDMCKRCSRRRKCLVSWEPVNGFPDPSDWLIEDQFDRENRRLKADIKLLKEKRDAVEAALKGTRDVLAQKEQELQITVQREASMQQLLYDYDRDIKRQEAQIQSLEEQLDAQTKQIREHTTSLVRAAQKISYLTEVKIEQSRELDSYRDVLQKTQQEIQRWSEKCRQIRRKQQDAERRLKKIREEYSTLRHSASFQLARLLTWLPRKIQCGIKRITSLTPFKIWRRFQTDIMNGYHHYARIMEKYGDDAQIYKTSGGTGDVYVAGLYFAEYLKTHDVNRKPVFTVIHKSGYAVAELFGIQNIELIPYDNRRSMVHLGIFLGFQNIHFTVIHHNPGSLYTSISSKLEAVNGFCSLDILRDTIYEGLQPSGIAHFNNNKWYISDIFSRNDLTTGQTVVLMPYAVSMKQIPREFWEMLAYKLRQRGYTVCTNSQGEKEPAIRGTKAVQIPIQYLVPFLNMAGSIVGVRSGIFDVTETANIRRVIFYTKVKGSGRGQGGHDQQFIDHFSFNKWFQRDDALEIEYSDEKPDESYVEAVLAHLSLPLISED